MKLHEKCKALGFVNLKEVSEITNRSVSTLISWEKTRPDFLLLVLDGALHKKHRAIISKMEGI